MLPPHRHGCPPCHLPVTTWSDAARTWTPLRAAERRCPPPPAPSPLALVGVPTLICASHAPSSVPSRSYPSAASYCDTNRSRGGGQQVGRQEGGRVAPAMEREAVVGAGRQDGDRAA